MSRRRFGKFRGRFARLIGGTSIITVSKDIPGKLSKATCRHLMEVYGRTKGGIVLSADKGLLRVKVRTGPAVVGPGVSRVHVLAKGDYSGFRSVMSTTGRVRTSKIRVMTISLKKSNSFIMYSSKVFHTHIPGVSTMGAMKYKSSVVTKFTLKLDRKLSIRRALGGTDTVSTTTTLERRANFFMGRSVRGVCPRIRVRGVN